LVALNISVPPSARRAPRAATPVNPAETRAKRVNRRAKPFSRLPAIATPLILRSPLVNRYFAKADTSIASLVSQSGTVKPAFYLSGAKIEGL
jgi:hypothetical protein